jgi:hypothetical protein
MDTVVVQYRAEEQKDPKEERSASSERRGENKKKAAKENGIEIRAPGGNQNVPSGGEHVRNVKPKGHDPFNGNQYN